MKRIISTLLLIVLSIAAVNAINLNIFKNDNSKNDENNPLLDSLYQVIDDQSLRIENMQTLLDSLQSIVDSLRQDESGNEDFFVVNKNFRLPDSYEFAGIKFDLKNERIRNKLQQIFDYEVKKAYKYIPRSTSYFPIFDQYFAQNNIPDDARYVAVAESYLSYMAYSSVGAAGIWQFMPGTGKQYKLKINEYLDERRNIFKATEAACQYLNNSNEYLLQREIDDWLLVMASYNAGLGNITKAVSEQGAKDFFSLIMRHDETNDYIWRAIAIKIIFDNEETLFGKKFEREPYLLDKAKVVKLELNGYHLLNEWAIAQGTNISAIWELNPWIKINKKCQGKYSKINQMILPPGEYQVLIPIDAVPDSAMLAEVQMKFLEQSKPVVRNDKIIHKVKRGETLSVIARKYGVTVTDLKAWNHLRRNKIVRGMTLVINKEILRDSVYADTTAVQIAQAPLKEDKPVTQEDKKPAKKQKDNKQKDKKKSKYVVKNGDTLYHIAKKIGVSQDKLISKNNLKTKKVNGSVSVNLQKGQVLFY